MTEQTATIDPLAPAVAPIDPLAMAPVAPIDPLATVPPAPAQEPAAEAAELPVRHLLPAELPPAVELPESAFVEVIDIKGLTVEHLSFDVRYIPNANRAELMRSAARSFITNRVSTAQAKTKSENEPWDRYEAAIKVNPLQTEVAQPTTPRTVTDVAAIVENAIKALYAGQRGRTKSGNKKERALRDPLVTQVTRAVVAAVYAEERAKDANYKYPSAQKKVGQDGIAYLEAMVQEKVAAGADEAELRKRLEIRYLKPARIMLGLEKPKTLADSEGIL